jgi:hypothetical protein
MITYSRSTPGNFSQILYYTYRNNSYLTEQQKNVRFKTQRPTTETDDMRSLTFVVPAIFITSFTTTSFVFDVNGNDRERLPAAVHALQFVSGMTPASSTMSQIRIYCS